MLHGYFWQRDLSCKSLVALWTTETYCIFLETFKLYLLIGCYRYSRTLRGQNSWLKVVILNRKLATRRVFLLATIDFKWTNNTLYLSRYISSRFSATDMYCTSLESLKHFVNTLFYADCAWERYQMTQEPENVPNSL